MSRQSQRPLSVAWRTILGRLGIFLIGVALVSSCASRPLRLDAAPWETALATDHVALPAVFVKGRPYVDLSVNGHGPYRFLVDTGSVGTAISQPVAKEAGIAASRKYWARVTGSSGQSEHQPMGTVDHLEAPGFSLGTVDVSIISPQSAALLDPPAKKFIGGIIGLSAFRNVRLEIDYAGKQVVVHRLDTETPPAGAGIAYTGSRPTVSIATPSTLHATTNAVIDTGSDSGFSLTDIGSYPLRVGLAKKDGYHHGVGGFWRPLFGQVAGDIRLGSAIWRDAMISSADENRIGGEALGSWRLVIDQQKKLLWLLHENQMETTTWTGPLDVDGRPAVYGFACISEGDSFVIREVDPGSRAERAGLKVGDRV
ncbi:MAG TPA: aspartyl protease family protein, partial [Lacunisphaera sp.]|nr:aspartyl protease family protein [Lacunisphaera sp.]